MRKLTLLLILLASSNILSQTGTPRFSAMQNGGFDKIDNGNLNFEFGSSGRVRRIKRRQFQCIAPLQFAHLEN